MTHFHGRALVTAMCLGQLGSLLPHVAVPGIMAEHLASGWLAAFAVLAAGVPLGPLALWWSRR
jgi:hypothetical protein